MQPNLPWIVKAPEQAAQLASKRDQACYYGVGSLAFEEPLVPGSFSTVWRCVDLLEGKVLAVKVHDSTDDREAAKFFADGDATRISYWEKGNEEIEVLKKIHGLRRSNELKNVVLLEQNRLVVIEYLPFETFAYNEQAFAYCAVLANGQEALPLRETDHPVSGSRSTYSLLLSFEGARWFARELLLGLQELQSRRVIHKDIKPENLRLSKPWPVEKGWLEWRRVELPEGAEAGDKIEPNRFGKIEKTSPARDELPLTPPAIAVRDVQRETIWDFGCKKFGNLSHLREAMVTMAMEDGMNKKEGEMSQKEEDNNEMPLLKLIDFNTAVVAEDDSLTIWDAEGTKSYTPPEALMRPDPKLRTFAGAPRDIWSVGVTLWVALVGTLPFWDPNPFREQLKIITEPVDFSKLPADLPDNMEKLMRGLLDKCPTTRLTIAAALELLD